MDDINHQNQSNQPPSIQSSSPSSHSFDGSKKEDDARSAVVAKETSTRSTKATAQASESASLAAVVEAAFCHRSLIPGLVESLGTSTSAGILPSRGADAIDSQQMDTGHPILPSISVVSNTALRLINDFNLPPFVTMSIKDSAPQLKLENPALIATNRSNEEGRGNITPTNFNLRRRLVVKGGIRGYRMSRATHGVTNGLYYYEAIIMGGDDIDIYSGVKRPLHESFDTNTGMDSATKRQKTGHVRIGWSKRSGDLQAPVGYDAYSYAVRDIGGSRIHKSMREDNWGGSDFGPGDVIGFAISLSGGDAAKSSATVPLLGLGSTISSDTSESSFTVGNYIRFFINGEKIGDKVFDNIGSGTYYPAVSCYSDSSVQLNFGPYFVFPPKGLTEEESQKMRPVSDLCLVPPSPDDVLNTVLSTSNEGKKSLSSSKKIDEHVLIAFKDLVRKEAAIRQEAYLRHVTLHKQEVLKLRKEKGLPTNELDVPNSSSSW